MYKSYESTTSLSSYDGSASDTMRLVFAPKGLMVGIPLLIITTIHLLGSCWCYCKEF